MGESQVAASRGVRLASGSPAAQRHATWLELFYDLVYVVAVAILAAQLSLNVSPTGVAIFVGLFIPVWWSWAGHTIFASRFGRDDSFQRGMTLLQMLAAAAMAVQIPGALGAGAAGFAAAYVATRATLLVLYLRARGEYPEARSLNTVLLTGYGLGAALWLISIAFPPPVIFAFWAVGLVVEFGTFVFARNVSRRFPVHTSHLPERFGLFTIIVLGEAVLAFVFGVANVSFNPLAILAALLGFAIVVAIWWNYFGYVDRAPLQCTLGNGQAYTFFHLPMVLGIIATGVGIEHIVVEASHAEFTTATLWLLGGGLVTWAAAFFGLQLLTYPRPERRRLTTTYGLASLAILPLVFVGPPVHPVVVLGLIGGVMAAVTYFEVRRRAAIPARAYVTRGAPPTPSPAERLREYRADGITVRFDPEVCFHAAECLRDLPQVFDLRNRPWVDPEAASVEEIMATIAKCPSGALTYELPPGAPEARKAKGEAEA